MKLKNYTNKLTTNVEEMESQSFGIAEDASVIIDILRNRLYEHKIQSSVQEVISNARDAMREVGKYNNDFEVTVPTRLNPVFKVRDFGPGVSPDRMANVFIKYGASTKRDTNEQTGGLGVGAKSPFSYTDSFTITTWIDGIKRVYIAHIGVNNIGRLDMVSVNATTEPNGTEVQVAVKPGDESEFCTAVRRAIYFWPQKPTVKGDAETIKMATGFKVGNIELIAGSTLPDFVCANNWSNEPLAVIDGIPYLINRKLVDKCDKLKKLTEFCHRKVIFHFGNGIVEVSASRESIADSKHTIEALEKLATKALVDVKTHVQGAFSKVNSTSEYLRVYTEMHPIFKVVNYAKYNGYSVEYEAIIGDAINNVYITEISCLDRRGRRIDKITKKVMDNRKHAIQLKDLNSLFYVDKVESIITQNKRIREYLKTKTKLVLIYNQIGKDVELQKVIDDLGAKKFSELAYTEVPREKKVKVEREKAEFCYHSLEGTRHRYTTLVDNNIDWLYVELDGVEWKGWDISFLRDLDRYLDSNYNLRICGLSTKVVNTVKNDPHYTPLKDWLIKYKPTQPEVNFVKKCIVNSSYVLDTIGNLKKLKDSFLVKMGKEYKELIKDTKRETPTMLRYLINDLPEIKAFQEKIKRFDDLITNYYPLLKDAYHTSYLNELAFYINASFDSKKEGN